MFFTPMNAAVGRGRHVVGFARHGCLAMLRDCGRTLLEGGGLRVASTALGILGRPACPVSPRSAGQGRVVVTTYVNDFLVVITLLLLVRVFSEALQSTSHAGQIAKCGIMNTIPDLSASHCKKLAGACIRRSTDRLAGSLLHFLNGQGSPNMFVVGLFDVGRSSSRRAVNGLIYKCVRDHVLGAEFVARKISFGAGSARCLLTGGVASFCALRKRSVLVITCPPLSRDDVPDTLLRSTGTGVLVTSTGRN